MQEETELGRELFGYKKDDVDILLAELHRDLRTAKEENKRLASELSDAMSKLSAFESLSYILKPDLPAITELKNTPNFDKLVKENLPGLLDIQGIKSVWIFDSEANILSALNQPDANIDDLTSTLALLDRLVTHLESKLGGGGARLIFIEFKETVLILNPLSSGMTLGVIASVSAPVGEILKVLDSHVPNLNKKLLQD